MPVSVASRYHGIAVLRVQDARRGIQPAIGLRPQPEPGPVRYQHRVAALETLEFLAWQYLGHSDSFWRIADENPLRFALDVRTGESVAIPALGEQTAIQRGRRF